MLHFWLCQSNVKATEEEEVPLPLLLLCDSRFPLRTEEKMETGQKSEIGNRFSLQRRRKRSSADIPSLSTRLALLLFSETGSICYGNRSNSRRRMSSQGEGARDNKFCPPALLACHLVGGSVLCYAVQGTSVQLPHQGGLRSKSV